MTLTLIFLKDNTLKFRILQILNISFQTHL